MERIFVRSSNVKSIGYKDNVIEVEFKNGSIYHYFGVTRNIFISFLNAPSKGKFVHQILKTYNYRRVV